MIHKLSTCHNSIQHKPACPALPSGHTHCRADVLPRASVTIPWGHLVHEKPALEANVFRGHGSHCRPPLSSLKVILEPLPHMHAENPTDPAADVEPAGQTSHAPPERYVSGGQLPHSDVVVFLTPERQAHWLGATLPTPIVWKLDGQGVHCGRPSPA